MPRLHFKPRRRARTCSRPQVEAMEGRLLLATIVVTGTGDDIADDGIVTLREAITAANTNAASGDATAGDPGMDTIAFDIPGVGVQTIHPLSALPTITDPVTIDGYTQPGARANTLATGSDAVLLIEINGVDGLGIGLTLDGGDSTIRGLVVNRFETGILVHSDRNVIAGNFVGTDAEGIADLGNDWGIRIQSGTANVVGGVSAAARNVASGNIYDNVNVGIGLDYTAPSGTIIQGNYLGTTAAGTGLVNADRTGNGIAVGSADGTVIGGLSALARNVISGNFNGIFISGLDTNLTVQGNYLGVDATGDVALGNQIGINGTFADSPGDNYLIGGSTAGAGNVISGNTYEGVYMTAYNLVFQGNLVGTNASGTAVIGNGSAGVRIANGGDEVPHNALIGGTTVAARNVIAGNGWGTGTSNGGILISGVMAGTRLVQGNLIGTLADGTTPAGNIGPGVETLVGATIGGVAAGSGNVVANNTNGGVIVGSDLPPYTTGVSILGNSIFNNAVAGIALGVSLVDRVPDAPKPDDPGDADVGPNNLQNYPLVTSAALTAGGATVDGSLNSRPLTAYTVEFFSNVSLDPNVPNGKQTFLGRTTVMTDATGNVTFAADVAAPPAGQSIVTATATDPDGNTSIFTIVPAVLSVPAANADLAVTVSGAPDPVNAGGDC